MRFELSEKIKKHRSKYFRTGEVYSLDEVLYIVDLLLRDISIRAIGDLVERHPNSLMFKFCEYRPINLDGSFDWKRSVASEEKVYDKAPVKNLGRWISFDPEVIKISPPDTSKFTSAELNLIKGLLG